LTFGRHADITPHERKVTLRTTNMQKRQNADGAFDRPDLWIPAADGLPLRAKWFVPAASRRKPMSA